VVFLFALGKYLVCPLAGFSFQVGDCFAGRGSTAALLRLLGCGCAGSSSGRAWWVWLEASPPCSPPTRLLIFFQSFKSISVGALGWWFLRLHQDLESVGGRSGGLGFDCAPAARLSRCGMEFLCTPCGFVFPDGVWLGETASPLWFSLLQTSPSLAGVYSDADVGSVSYIGVWFFFWAMLLVLCFLVLGWWTGFLGGGRRRKTGEIGGVDG